MEWGLSVTSVDSATGYQAVCSGARSANVVIGTAPPHGDHSRLVRPTDHLRHSIVRSVNESNAAATPSAIARSYLESFASGSAEEIAAHVSPDFVNEHTSALGAGCVGQDVYRQRLVGFLADMVDLRYEIEHLVVEGSEVAAFYTMDRPLAR